LPGVLDIALTTNGALLATKAAALKAAGLRRITVSLDSIDPAVFGAMNGVGYPVARILSGIEAARRAGLDPLKINVVVRRGINDGTVVQTARYFHGSGCIVRFIEYMDVGSTNGWTMDQVVSGADIVKQLDAAMPLEAISPTYRGEVARRYRYRDGGGEIGIVTSVTQPFCRDCTRARLSSAGVLYTCLFATRGLDLGKMLRSQCSDDEIAFAIRTAWTGRQDRYSELRTASSSAEAKVEMSHIGG
ncbi:MAG: radical SAM protein, partial [Candidatus Eremiobacteraeota bacterium]|nr:radical SAM protein [Candidatus Eremiobacteraeota bacterium]